MKSQTTALSVYGLKDLIAGVTPTMSSWSTNPTDASKITDGDITTYCNTGNKIAGGAWQAAYFTWDLGTFYNILITAAGNMTTTAGDAYVFVELWDGTNWIQCKDRIFQEVYKTATATGASCSKIRLAFMASAIATITPNIRELCVWRLQ